MKNTPAPPRSQNTLNQIMVPIGPPPPLPPNLPSGQLIQGSREDYIRIGLPLYKASISGDWKSAKAILDQKPELVGYAITKNFDTPLHIAASAKRTVYVESFVENLLNMMKREDLELQNKSYNTAFSLAVTAGNLKTAKMILGKNRAVLEIPGSGGMMPLYVAALFSRADMVRYLYGMSDNLSGDLWTNENRGSLLLKCVEADIFDIAIKIVNAWTQLTTDKRILGDVLLLLAKTDAFRRNTPNIILRPINIIFGKRVEHVLWESYPMRFLRPFVRSFVVEFDTMVEHALRESEALQLLRIIWNKIAIMPDTEIDQILLGPPVEIEENRHKKITYPSRVPFIAAEMGNVTFIIELLRSYPDLIWTVDDEGLSIFHVAVKHRQEDIYNLLYEIGSPKELITITEDKNGSNMLHIVAKIANPRRLQTVAGVALQMQRELLWFQEVQRMIPCAYREKKNRVGETPHEIFTKTHHELVAKSERSIKETAPQGLVGATIIATMVFTAAFTAPGGYDQNTGIPMMLHKPAFRMFLIADALALIFSSSSILMFLTMFTTRYTESDFVVALPDKLKLALATLYLSIVSMLIAFSASFFVLYYDKDLKWIPILVTGFAALIMAGFVVSQFTFLMDIFYSTYRTRALFNPWKSIVFVKKSF